MQRLFDDVIDLVRGRIQPLAHYQYPFWQPALLLTVMGVFASARAIEIGGPLEGRLLFFVLFTWMQILLFVRFMGWWVRLAGARLEASLFGLVVLTNSPQLLEPLASWLPDDAAQGVTLVLSVLSVIILVRALSAVSGVSKLRVFLGALCYTPLAILLLTGLTGVAGQMGWIELPPELMESASQGASAAGASSAK
ncbi:hypothetical protein [Crenobacter cavernae]|uniref:Yip1 domain-containing protein n=1 Tax=Crenobacter cavernae TaxID=2290923 RepID=A0A345Y757_9NEIS|nr:hypothetical protein [Crenobacter cavernae]AXK39759.1 hypothetical protein DWG20_10090 [Crenobacter cavernae]